MWSNVAGFIGRHQLLSHDGLHLVALSGGADSVALLLVLKRLGYRLEAAHCNFHLRGEESDRDEAFVCQLCAEQNIPIHRAHFDTKAYAALHKVSIEMAARELRYHYFEQLRQDLGADTICVAHHRDDAVETLLMNLMNGTGIHGLTGIRPKNGRIVRPLLGVSRAEIEEFLHSIGQTFVTDSTNAVNDVLRNKIRLDLLPLMLQILPKSSENIAKTADNMKEVEAVYEAVIQTDQARLVKSLQPAIGTFDQREAEAIGMSDLLALPSSECFLFEWLRPYGFTSAQILQIAESLEAPSGKEVPSGKTFSSATHVLYVDRSDLIVAPVFRSPSTLIIPEDGLYKYQDKTAFKISFSNDISIFKSDTCILLDKEKVEFPLKVRIIQRGDRFTPFGMNGSKLVSDYLTDRKLSLWAKRSQLVVTDAHDHILWLVGHRIAHPFRITPSTTTALRIELLS
ncbi:MAG: tRNA lysidine(34) synthetase TilS [Prevotella sp.]|nr:tRNA lysidine(34) synthetase TilS [Prevotella sp.]